jgi:tetratricopeptide (TPR) repeat protein
MIKTMKKLFYLAFMLVLGVNVFAQKGSGESFYNSGTIKLDNGNFEGALKDFNEAIQKEPNEARYYIKRAYTKVQLEDFKGAIEDYNFVLQEDPNNVFALLSRGTAKKKINDRAGAMADYDRVLSLDPKNCEAYINRGFVKKAMSDESGACKDWNLAKKNGCDEAKIVLYNNRCK